VSRLIRIAMGLALFAGGLTFLAYGIAQAIENGNCGTDKYGRSVGPPCPTGFGPMIVRKQDPGLGKPTAFDEQSAQIFGDR